MSYGEGLRGVSKIELQEEQRRRGEAIETLEGLTLARRRRRHGDMVTVEILRPYWASRSGTNRPFLLHAFNFRAGSH